MNRIKIIEIDSAVENMVAAYHEFISQVFPGISFKEWHAKGYWTKNYQPFAIFKNDKIIANASASIMDVFIREIKCKAIQIGAVGTLPEYQNQGLSRELMNHIINNFQDEVDLFFLHANESVLTFYPKFGFDAVKENIFITDANLPDSNFTAKKLDIGNKKDYALLIDLLNRRTPLTQLFGAENHGFISMWHVLNLYRDQLYYLADENAIFIFEEKLNKLHIIDVIFSDPFDLQGALPKIIASDSLSGIKYYFPNDQLNYNYDKILSDDTGLFILGNWDKSLDSFRFPETAVT